MELKGDQITTRVGSTLPVQSIKACLVYDAKGKIHHQHSVLTLVGGREPGEDEVAKDALFAAANRRMPPTGPLHVLHVPHDAMEPGKRYRVDVQKKALTVEG